MIELIVYGTPAPQGSKRHVGLGAPIFETTPDGLARRLYRLRADGFDIDFTDDTKALRP